MLRAMTLSILDSKRVTPSLFVVIDDRLQQHLVPGMYPKVHLQLSLLWERRLLTKSQKFVRYYRLPSESFDFPTYPIPQDQSSTSVMFGSLH